MSTRYIVGPGQEFTYPADKDSLKRIQQAGGVSKLKDVNGINFKTVKEGEDCSDMPASSLATYLERGWVVVATDDVVTGDDTGEALSPFDGVERRKGDYR